jgi:hypothetical protein
MPFYTDEQVAQAQRVAQELARDRQELTQRVERLEAKPTVDSWQQENAQGRAIAREKGYSAAEIDRLENFMVQRGIAHHQDAIAVDPTPPTSRFWRLGAIPEDEMDMLMKGDETGFLSTSIRRALNGE